MKFLIVLSLFLTSSLFANSYEDFATNIESNPSGTSVTLDCQPSELQTSKTNNYLISNLSSQIMDVYCEVRKLTAFGRCNRGLSTEERCLGRTPKTVLNLSTENPNYSGILSVILEGYSNKNRLYFETDGDEIESVKLK